MKNFFKTTLYLSIFALAGIFFQISCSNDSVTQNSLLTGKLIYTRQSTGNQPQIWVADYDGTNQTQIPVTLPANVSISMTNSNGSSLKISPDGQKIFFVAYNSGTSLSSIYICDIDGSNLHEVISPPTFEVIELGGLN